MGAWGERAFENDAANDWAYELEETDDLRAVEAALRELEEVGDGYLDQEVACVALAACEVIARLRGQIGYRDAYTRKVDGWVAAHPLAVAPELVARARSALDRILMENSELHQLWEQTDATAWRAAMDELRRRLGS